MARTETVELMNMCMVTDGERAVVQNRQNPNWPGVTFPGGHVEPGEPFVDAVIREVREETGLTISAPRLCGIKQWTRNGVRRVVLLYTARRFTGELTGSSEGEVWWEAMENLPSLPLAHDMEHLLRVFLEDDLGEFDYRIEGGTWIPELK